MHWNRDRKFIFKEKNLWNIIEGTEVCPGSDKEQKSNNESSQNALNYLPQFKGRSEECN